MDAPCAEKHVLLQQDYANEGRTIQVVLATTKSFSFGNGFH